MKDVLYSSNEMIVTYRRNPDNREEINSRQDHEIWVRVGDKWDVYDLPRGVLRELAETSKRSRKQTSKNHLEFLDMISSFNRNLVDMVELDFFSLGCVLEKAYSVHEENS